MVMEQTRHPRFPEFKRSYKLAGEQIRQYRKNGHIYLREVATPEKIQRYKPIIEAVIKKKQNHSQSIDSEQGNVVKTANMRVKIPLLEQFILGKRFGHIAAHLMGVDGVRIYQDCAIFKQSGAPPVPWHQDKHHWPIDTENVITMWLSLERTAPEMGAMMFASGSHRDGFLGHIPTSNRADTVFSNYIDEQDFTVQGPHGMKTGDATFHSGWVLHRTPANKTEETRKTMKIVYFEDGARAIEPQNTEQKKDLDRYLKGTSPGEVIRGSVNPVVFSRK
ncbi:MAG: phytanoyl-CoA dioxygenase family protein [bacterium]